MTDVSVAIADHIAIVTLDRPPVNAITRTTMHEMIAIFHSLGENRDVRVVVFTAFGDRAFMAGVDLQTVGESSAATATSTRFTTDPASIAREAMWAITDCAVPVIGAINGPALGAGLAFAACCDVLFASETPGSALLKSTLVCSVQARTYR